ncbi:cytochrome P450 86B1-like [Glycine soja]|uniref:cytochrome P450 86B1-like n=1 Tax=Glycine soja TaxID=3848 RepID=UPI00023DE519|nr:cytochrome P450 86B1-like [Glycine soja]|eukprot:XP_025983306.1 cytochrome P450 86B1-like [Glycine max]
MGFLMLIFYTWKQEREILHSLLKRKKFKIFLQLTIQKKIENCLIPFLMMHPKLELRWTCKMPFRGSPLTLPAPVFLDIYDPICLPNMFTKLSHFAYQKALIVMEDVAFHRHITPRCLWKLQEWLQIGQEKKFKEAIKAFDKFLHERIASKREEQSRCNNHTKKEDDNTHSDLIRVLMEEGAEKGKIMDDKYLRDTAFTLVSAGSGTVSAGPRSCLGKDITFIEMKMVAVALLWRFHMQVVEGHPITPRLSITLGTEHGLKVKVTERCI